MAKKVFSPCFFSCVTCFVKNINALIQRHHLLQATGEREEKKATRPEETERGRKRFLSLSLFLFSRVFLLRKKKKT